MKKVKTYYAAKVGKSYLGMKHFGTFIKIDDPCFAVQARDEYTIEGLKLGIEQDGDKSMQGYKIVKLTVFEEDFVENEKSN